MIKNLSILLGCLLLIGCSSANMAKKIGTGGGWASEHTRHCPAYRFSEDGKMEEPKNAYKHYHISYAGDEGIAAIKRAKQYVLQRGGPDFMDKLTIEYIAITYPEKIDEFLKMDKDAYILSKCEVRYYVEFMLTVAGSAKYRFGIYMDDELNHLHWPPEFPDYNINSDSCKIIAPERACKIAQQKHRHQLKDAQSMALEFDRDVKDFVWEIKGEEKDIPYRQVEYWIVKVHAATGQVVGTQMRITSSHNTRYF